MATIDLTDKTALITGATRGIGRAIAEQFVAAGADVLITGTSDASADSLLSSLPTTHANQRIEFIAADFSKPSGVAVFKKRLLKEERIDVCINNAGTNHIKAIKDIEFLELERIHSINLHAPFAILAVALEKMKTQGWGRVVNIGSLWSQLSRSGRAMYSSSKHGLMGLTVTAALEYAAHNILVNMVSPGFVMTDLTRKSLTPEEKMKIMQSVPVGRFAEPKDIAETVLFFGSDLNKYITGQNIIIDGGYVCE